MWYFILFLIVAYQLYKRFAFRGEARYRLAMIHVMEQMYQVMPSPQVGVELASAYMQGHRFYQAKRLFAKHANHFDQSTNQIIQVNIAYCEHPLPWIHGAKDFQLSYFRELFIVRLGGRRSIMITQLAGQATDNYLIAQGEM